MKLPLGLRSGLFVAAAFAVACGESEEAPPAAAAPKEKAAAPPPEIDPALKKRLDDELKESRDMVAQALALKQKGIELERSSGTGAGRANFNEAANLITAATNKMGNWTEPTSIEIKLTPEQRAYYVAPIVVERTGWIQEAAKIGLLIQRR